MAGNNFSGSSADQLTEGGNFVPLSVEREAFAEARADRSLAFAEIAFHLGRLGIGEGRYYRFPLDSYSERRVAVVPDEDFLGHPVWYTYVNDEVPHPNPAMMDVRRLHMSVYAARMVGKAVSRYQSHADRIVATGTRWHATGKYFLGPHIAHYPDMGVVDVYGRYPYVQPDLPPIEANPSTQQVLDRTEDARQLARTLAQLDDIYAVDASVFVRTTD